jgi:hypothetical protein
MDLALPRDVAHDALAIIRGKAPAVEVFAPPTALEELLDIQGNDESDEARRCAKDALLKISKAWNISPLIIRGVRRDIVESIGQKLRDCGLIPPEERHDSHIVAEAALSDCEILISSDQHLSLIDKGHLNVALKECDVYETVIFTPHQIVQTFAGRRR